ncbi:hypothetical protein E5E91_04710 [Deinococcus radiodurans R1 = ATCC 13939 = DSM 20539]|uniref:Uncharacterized protein n=1 Tax=Deinococcus radiodurans (strain ATCC 13939 / DSM 20539 / JCM 16871 / CCUG 27074 / LMG 4051 / NBRC 15346 / NCIMB 9279 / VKM B-1422 / R1) TaxID=243230 RepID=Q9RVW3_DEIRA|nr:hypothetical protein DR_0908 [Deinococcus radiodurans R1 = ATCC 13939 = DSM 20539]QEM72726.1 hypothetical protein DXG80_00620 [Deinococcus radiodurans]UDL01675.1 hypothetical protein E5E91_04710 [Deinococcus radiodurans R1 = ATCC 13939 = DSM 20539]HCE65405.1 hypothetical protein [Deinococcus radiodurans]
MAGDLKRRTLAAAVEGELQRHVHAGAAQHLFLHCQLPRRLPLQEPRHVAALAAGVMHAGKASLRVGSCRDLGGHLVVQAGGGFSDSALPGTGEQGGRQGGLSSRSSGSQQREPKHGQLLKGLHDQVYSAPELRRRAGESGPSAQLPPQLRRQREPLALLLAVERAGLTLGLRQGIEHGVGLLGAALTQQVGGVAGAGFLGGGPHARLAVGGVGLGFALLLLRQREQGQRAGAGRGAGSQVHPAQPRLGSRRVALGQVELRGAEQHHRVVGVDAAEQRGKGRLRLLGPPGAGLQVRQLRAAVEGVALGQGLLRFPHPHVERFDGLHAALHRLGRGPAAALQTGHEHHKGVKERGDKPAQKEVQRQKYDPQRALPRHDGVHQTHDIENAEQPQQPAIVVKKPTDVHTETLRDWAAA